MHTGGPPENQIIELSCAQLARFRVWFATHKEAVLTVDSDLDVSDRLELLTEQALAVARQIPADGGACSLRSSTSPRSAH